MITIFTTHENGEDHTKNAISFAHDMSGTCPIYQSASVQPLM